jgi:ribonuclease D
MQLIADSAQLVAFCARVAKADFLTVDTEFMRERTYWPQLCLVQVAGPEEVAAIDPLADGMDLRPLLDLLYDERILKVFHAARQDIEIFFHMTGRIPAPLFDTQVAAMVCGYGDSVSYETLAAQLAGARIDKSARFTDWSARPLTERQVTYALADVTHLRKVYDGLAKRLTTSGRAHWLQEEMATLLEPGTYRLDPVEAWRRLKPRAGSKPRLLAILREVAAWREREAQRRDIPRNRVIRDETIMEIAAHAPSTVEDIARLRGLSKSLAEGRMGQDILLAVANGVATPESEAPHLPPPVEMPGGLGPVVELLKVLLKMKCERQQVAQKLVASSSDLERIAADDDADVAAMHGWRREVFGEDALALKHGRLALTMKGKRIVIMPLEDKPQAAPNLKSA